jgi:cbb3-type cytochrome oxidase subunit 3
MIIAIVLLSVLCAGLLIALAVLIYLYRDQSRTNRRQADYIRELLAIRNANIHRVAVPEKPLQQAIDEAIEPDYSHIIAPYESRKSTF